MSFGWPVPRHATSRVDRRIGQSLMHGGRTTDHGYDDFVAMDTHKQTISVAIAEAGRVAKRGFWAIFRAARTRWPRWWNAWPRSKSAFCYEAGRCGYGLYRQVVALGHECMVFAPSLVPTRPGGRVKTDRRGAMTHVSLFRSGELTPVWVPDDPHEAMRDLCRARQAAMEALRRASASLEFSSAPWTRLFQRKALDRKAPSLACRSTF